MITEYRKIINSFDNAPNQATNFGQKIGLKKMMENVERITPIIKLYLKLPCYGQVYVIIVMHIYL